MKVWEWLSFISPGTIYDYRGLIKSLRVSSGKICKCKSWKDSEGVECVYGYEIAVALYEQIFKKKITVAGNKNKYNVALRNLKDGVI